MKRKIELVCWILFTLCSGICFFINFMSKPPVDDTHKFTLYMIGAATVSLLYPGTMFILGLRNSYLYDKLNKLAEEKSETKTVKSTQISKTSISGYTIPDMKTLVSTLISDKKPGTIRKKPIKRICGINSSRPRPPRKSAGCWTRHGSLFMP